MAILVFLRKTRETETELEYRFGDSRDQLDRSVLIDKARETWQATDGQDGPDSNRAASWVVHRYRATGTWIEGGTVAG